MREKPTERLFQLILDPETDVESQQACALALLGRSGAADFFDSLDALEPREVPPPGELTGLKWGWPFEKPASKSGRTLMLILGERLAASPPTWEQFDPENLRGADPRLRFLISALRLCAGRRDHIIPSDIKTVYGVQLGSIITNTNPHILRSIWRRSNSNFWFWWTRTPPLPLLSLAVGAFTVLALNYIAVASLVGASAPFSITLHPHTTVIVPVLSAAAILLWTGIIVSVWIRESQLTDGFFTNIAFLAVFLILPFGIATGLLAMQVSPLSKRLNVWGAKLALSTAALSLITWFTLEASICVPRGAELFFLGGIGAIQFAPLMQIWFGDRATHPLLSMTRNNGELIDYLRSSQQATSPGTEDPTKVPTNVPASTRPSGSPVRRRVVRSPPGRGSSSATRARHQGGVSARRKHLFISYARADEAMVLELASRSEALGREAWIDRRTAPGELWEEFIRAKVRDAVAVILVASPEGAESIWVQRELELAREYGKPIVPLALVDWADLPDQWSSLQGDVWSDTWDFLPTLLARISDLESREAYRCWCERAEVNLEVYHQQLRATWSDTTRQIKSYGYVFSSDWQWFTEGMDSDDYRTRLDQLRLDDEREDTASCLDEQLVTWSRREYPSTPSPSTPSQVGQLDHVDRPILLVGGPGAGKSALVRRCVLRLFDAPRLALVVPAPWLATQLESGPQTIETVIGSVIASVTGDERWAPAHAPPLSLCVLVLDGVDEIPTRVTRLSVIQWFLNQVTDDGVLLCAALLTCRGREAREALSESDVLRDRMSLVELAPLGHRQRRQLLERRLQVALHDPALARIGVLEARAREAYDPTYVPARKILQTPMLFDYLLNWLGDAANQGATLPEDAPRLLRASLEGMWSRAEEQLVAASVRLDSGHMATAKAAVRSLAWRLLSVPGDRWSTSWEDILAPLRELSQQDVKTIRTVIAKSGVLVPTLDPGGVEFHHPALLAHFAAEEIVRIWTEFFSSSDSEHNVYPSIPPDAWLDNGAWYRFYTAPLLPTAAQLLDERGALLLTAATALVFLSRNSCAHLKERGYSSGEPIFALDAAEDEAKAVMMVRGPPLYSATGLRAIVGHMLLDLQRRDLLPRLSEPELWTAAAAAVGQTSSDLMKGISTCGRALANAFRGRKFEQFSAEEELSFWRRQVARLRARLESAGDDLSKFELVVLVELIVLLEHCGERLREEADDSAEALTEPERACNELVIDAARKIFACLDGSIGSPEAARAALLAWDLDSEGEDDCRSKAERIFKRGDLFPREVTQRVALLYFGLRPKEPVDPSIWEVMTQSFAPWYESMGHEDNRARVLGTLLFAAGHIESSLARETVLACFRSLADHDMPPPREQRCETVLDPSLGSATAANDPRVAALRTLTDREEAARLSRVALRFLGLDTRAASDLSLWVDVLEFAPLLHPASMLEAAASAQGLIAADQHPEVQRTLRKIADVGFARAYLSADKVKFEGGDPFRWWYRQRGRTSQIDRKSGLFRHSVASRLLWEGLSPEARPTREVFKFLIRGDSLMTLRWGGRTRAHRRVADFLRTRGLALGEIRRLLERRGIPKSEFDSLGIPSFYSSSSGNSRRAKDVLELLTLGVIILTVVFALAGLSDTFVAWANTLAPGAGDASVWTLRALLLALVSIPALLWALAIYAVDLTRTGLKHNDWWEHFRPSFLFSTVMLDDYIKVIRPAIVRSAATKSDGLRVYCDKWVADYRERNQALEAEVQRQISLLDPDGLHKFLRSLHTLSILMQVSDEDGSERDEPLPSRTTALGEQLEVIHRALEKRASHAGASHTPLAFASATEFPVEVPAPPLLAPTNAGWRALGRITAVLILCGSLVHVAFFGLLPSVLLILSASLGISARAAVIRRVPSTDVRSQFAMMIFGASISLFFSGLFAVLRALSAELPEWISPVQSSILVTIGAVFPFWIFCGLLYHASIFRMVQRSEPDNPHRWSALSDEWYPRYTRPAAIGALSTAGLAAALFILAAYLSW